QQLKSETGFAKVAGVELVLLDSVRYYHKAGGINGVAQIVHDIGSKASPRKLARAAALYENSAVRRLGFLLDHFGLESQSKVLVPFARNAKSIKPLDPSVKPLMDGLSDLAERDSKWMLAVNESVEVDL
ncbi:MAG TPA: type IV toxin-antitoxin system AbiEi family antitoxin, partial [Candidatus Melainabacteria bacterium]|nr:type IV toxin-antitoxin system AbiEi family antitoxin [Candidatus Melainabacteria bacterium]